MADIYSANLCRRIDLHLGPVIEIDANRVNDTAAGAPSTVVDRERSHILFYVIFFQSKLTGRYRSKSRNPGP